MEVSEAKLSDGSTVSQVGVYTKGGGTSGKAPHGFMCTHLEVPDSSMADPRAELREEATPVIPVLEAPHQKQEWHVVG